MKSGWSVPGGISTGRHPVFFALATFVLVVTVLRVAEDVLIPIALAVLLAFLLSPLVVRLMRWGIPKTLAIIVTVTFAFSILGVIGWIVTTQVVNLIEELPRYEQNIQDKVSSLKRPGQPTALSRTSGLVKKIQKEMEAPAPVLDAEAPDEPSEPTPVPVEVKAPEPTAIEVAQQILSPIASPAATAGIVIVFVVAMLFQREDMRDRLIKVVSAGELNVATQAVDDAARRVSRYLAMQLVVNATYGVPVGIALYFIGIPNALLWGLLCTLLRFIPFLGPWIAAAFPIALAVAVDPGWMKLIYVATLFIVMEVVSNNIIEVILYGASTGISTLALLVAAVFWTWLWGPAGLFLSTPLTVLMMVLGKYVPGMKFLSVLLGSEPVLEPPAQFYQRMLAMDADEMTALAMKTVSERPLVEFYNDVFVPALIMAEQDRNRGTLAEVRQKFIFESSRELIEELERRGETEDEESSAGKPAASEEKRPRPAQSATPLVLGVPARDDADELVARMLRHLLRERGIATEISTIAASADDGFRCISEHNIGAVFVSALPPAALTSAKQVCRRLKERCPEVRVLVGVWSREANAGELKLQLRRPRPDEVVTNLAEAVTQLETWTTTRPAPAAPPVPAATNIDRERRERLQAAEPEELFELVMREVAQAFGVPLSLVSIVDADQQFWKSHVGHSPVRAQQHEGEVAANGHLPPGDDLLVVPDTSKDPRFASNPHLIERGVRFYASMPLRTRTGHAVGMLCVIDTKPREVAEAERELLRQRAVELIEAVESRGESAGTSKEVAKR